MASGRSKRLSLMTFEEVKSTNYPVKGGGGASGTTTAPMTQIPVSTISGACEPASPSMGAAP